VDRAYVFDSYALIAHFEDICFAYFFLDIALLPPGSMHTKYQHAYQCNKYVDPGNTLSQISFGMSHPAKAELSRLTNPRVYSLIQ
jgi:hypothetical protein